MPLIGYQSSVIASELRRDGFSDNGPASALDPICPVAFLSVQELSERDMILIPDHVHAFSLASSSLKAKVDRKSSFGSHGEQVDNPRRSIEGLAECSMACRALDECFGFRILLWECCPREWIEL